MTKINVPVSIKVPVLVFVVSSYLLFFGRMLNPNIILNSGKDAIRYFYPVRFYLHERLSLGEFPFWTERMFGGYPIYKDGEAGYLNIINAALIYVFGPVWSFKIIHFLTYLTGAVGLYFYCKNKSINFLGWLVSHFTYFFNYFALYHQQHQGIIFGYYLLPAFLYLIDNYKLTGKFKFLILIVLLFTHLIYFGAFQMVLIILMACGVWFFLDGKLTAKNFMDYVFACSLVLCLALPFLYGYYDMYVNSSRAKNKINWREGSFSPVNIINIFYPHIYRHQDHYMGGMVNKEFTIQETYIYIGLSSFILGILGYLFSKPSFIDNKKYIVIIAIFIIFGLNKSNFLFNFFTPPIISAFRYWGRLVVLFNFAFAIYAGSFISKLEDFEKHRQKPKINKTNLIIILIAALYLLATSYNQDLIKTVRVLSRRDYVFDYLYVYLFVFICWVIFILALFQKPKFLTKFKYLFVLVAVLDLAFFGYLVMNKRFIGVNKIFPNFPRDKNAFENKRIIVLEGNLRGNNTLYYKFWSLFGYSQSTNYEYEKTILDMGFGSVRAFDIDHYNEEVSEKLRKLGVSFVVDNLGNVTDNIFPKDDDIFYSQQKVLITHEIRSEGYHQLIVNALNEGKVLSRIRYDKNWRVSLNKNPTKTSKEGLYLSFDIPKGNWVVEIKYIPQDLYVSSFLGFSLGLLLLAIYVLLNRNNKYFLVFLLIWLFFVLSRFPYGKYTILNSDGARWHRRSEKFLEAIKNRDFSSTYQHYQPGITLMWINSMTKKISWELQDILVLPRWSLENSNDFPYINKVSKAILVIVLSTIFLYQVLVIDRIFNRKISLLYGLLVILEPYLNGIDRWFHLTSLESHLAFASFLTYLYALKNNEIKLYFLSGILLGFSVLSKTTSLIVLAPVLIIHIFKYWRNKKYLTKTFLAFLFGFFMTGFLLFPALWVNFKEISKKLISAILFSVSGDIRSSYYKPPLSYFYYLIILAFKLSPITVLIFLAYLLNLFKYFVKKIESVKPTDKEVGIILYIFVYFLLLSLASKKIDRYFLPLIPPILLLVSLYLSKIKFKILLLVCLLHMFVFLHAVLIYKENLSGYYSPMLGGAKKALIMGFYENNGEYFSSAALYLNNKFLYNKPYVYVPDNYESFSYYYQGVTQTELKPNTDYILTSIDFDRKTPRIYKNCIHLEAFFGPKYEIPYVYLYKCEKS